MNHMCKGTKGKNSYLFEPDIRQASQIVLGATAEPEKMAAAKNSNKLKKIILSSLDVSYFLGVSNDCVT